MFKKIRINNKLINIVSILGIALLLLFLFFYLSLKYRLALKDNINSVEIEYSKATNLAKDLLFYSQKLNLTANDYLTHLNDVDLQYYILLNNELKNGEKIDFYLYSTYYYLINHREKSRILYSYVWKDKLFNLQKISNKSKTQLIGLYYALIKQSNYLQNNLFSLEQNSSLIDTIGFLVENLDSFQVNDTLSDSLKVSYVNTKVSIKDTFRVKNQSIQSSVYEQSLLFSESYLDLMHLFQNEKSSKIKQLRKTENLYSKISYIIGVLILIVFFIGAREIINALKFNLSYLSVKIAKLNQAEIINNKLQFSPFIYKETIELSQELDYTISNQNKLISSIQNFANEDYQYISEGNSKLDKILNKASRNVKNLFLSTKQIQESQKNEIWVNEALANFNEVLRTAISTGEQYYFTVLKSIIKGIDANQGGIFVLKKSETTDDYLELQASYAYNIERKLKKEIVAGDGVLGNLIYEKKTIYLDNLPKDYVYISSGIGKSKPKYLLIQPLLAGQDLIGAIEVASFQPIEKFQQIYLKRAAENLSSVISSLLNQDEMQYLLKNSKLQSETLAVQEEELRQNLEELKATEDEILKKEFEMKNFEKQLSEAFLRIEVDKNLRILNANPLFLKAFNLKFMEIDDLSFTSFLSREIEELFVIKWKNFLKKKHTFKVVGKFIYNQKKIKLVTTFIPLLNSDKMITKVIILANPTETETIT